MFLGEVKDVVLYDGNYDNIGSEEEEVDENQTGFDVLFYLEPSNNDMVTNELDASENEV